MTPRTPDRFRNLTDAQFEELCAMEEMEEEWRRTLPRHSDMEWLAIFPEARGKWGPVVRRKLKMERMFLEAHIDDAMFEAQTKLRYGWYGPEVDRDITEELIKDSTRRYTDWCKKQIRAIDGRLGYLRTLLRPVDSVQGPQRITEGMIARAKEYPIEQLVEVNRQGFAQCIWHNDKKPSMFCKKNFAHCFTCGKSGDTISVVMEKEGRKFREAVLRLQ